MKRKLLSILALLAIAVGGANSAWALETYDFQSLCMAIGKGGPWAVNDGGDAGFTLGTEESPVVMHYLGDYTDKGYSWNSRFAYEYVADRGKFTMRNKNNKKDSNCGMFSWDYAHYFSILDLKDGDKVTITIGTGTVTFASATAIGVSVGDAVTSKTTYTISTTEESCRLDIQMAKATLIAKIEIEPYGVETVPVVTLSPKTLKLIPGATSKLKVEVSPAAATVWTTSDPTVATVAEDGTVTAVAAGTATITNKWTSEVSDATASDACVVTVADVDLSSYSVVKSYDFTTMGDVTLTLESEVAGKIYNAANNTNNNVFFCTNEGLELVAVQAAVASNKGWSIIDGSGLFLASGAGRCAAIGGIAKDQIVEFFYTGSGFYTKSDGSDAGIRKTALNEGIGRVIYRADEAGMIGFELDKGNAVTAVNIYDVPVSITTEKEYVTYVTDRALDFSEVSGLTAYVVSAVSALSATLTQVTTVPANIGIILEGTAGSSYNVPVIASADAPETNLLKAAVTATEVGANEVYILKDGEFRLVNAASTVPAGKAYLPKPAASEARALTIEIGGKTTGISKVEASVAEGAEIYNMIGQRVAQPAKGLYIVNGKKVIVK